MLLNLSCQLGHLDFGLELLLEASVQHLTLGQLEPVDEVQDGPGWKMIPLLQEREGRYCTRLRITKKVKGHAASHSRIFVVTMANMYLSSLPFTI